VAIVAMLTLFSWLGIVKIHQYGKLERRKLTESNRK